MAFYKQDIVDINLNTGNIHRSFLNHAIGYKNDDADRFGIRTFRDGVPQDLTGASCQAVFMAPNGSKIALTSYGTVSGNVAYVTLPPACYDYEGQFCLAIQLVGGGVTGTMRIVDGMVVNTGASGTVAPTSSVPTYQEIIAQYDAMVAATAAANGAIAATYSGSATYKVGDYCIHDGGLYRCTTAITTAEAWNAAHWTATKIGPDVSDLKSALTKMDVPYKSEHFQFSDTGSSQTNRTGYPLIEGNSYIIYNRSADYSVTIRSNDGSATVHDFGSVGKSNAKRITVGTGEGGNLKTYGRAVNIDVDNTDYIYYQVSRTLKYDAQTLTDSQKAQVRTNIGASSATDVASLQTDLETLEAKTIESVANDLVWSKGAFESGGYTATSSNSYKYSQKLSAGVYTIITPNTLRWEAFQYNSDVSGTEIQEFTGMKKTLTVNGQFVVTISPVGGGSLVGMDDEIAKFKIETQNTNSIEARLERLSAVGNSQAGSLYCHPLIYQNTGLRIARMNNSIVTTNDTGLSTRAISIYAPTRILFDDESLMVRVNRYSTNLSFNGTLLETLRSYDYGCDYIVEGDSYPIYIAVGIKYADDRSMTNTDLVNASAKFSVKSLEAQPEYADISMFKKIGVAGDSWSAGTIYNEADTVGVSRTGQGWAENLARQSGVECVNFAKGGTSVRTWYNENSGYGGLKQLLNDDAVGLYILSMGGSNDWTSSANGGRGWELNPGEGESEDPTLYYYGTIADITGYQDYHDYPLTFYGYYGRIIEQIMEHAPNSRIIITTPNTYPTNSEKCSFCYAATAEIAEHYGIPYMDFRKDAFFPVWADQNMLNGLHPIASTYSGMAKAVGRLFAKLVYDEWEYFRDYNGSLTTVPVTWQPLTK